MTGFHLIIWLLILCASFEIADWMRKRWGR